MIETLQSIGITVGRVLTVLPLLLMMTLFMGKRAIGELPVFDFLIIISLGSVVGADIADPNIEHIPTAVAIITLGVFQRVVSKWKISNRKLGKLLTFEPTVVVHNGKILDQNIKNIRYSLDNILQMLRLKDVFDVSEVETAVIEANGSLSVLKKPRKKTVSLEDMNIPNKMSSITFPVIVEGSVYSNVLEQFNVNEAWLMQQLSTLGITKVESVFLATINRQLQLHVSLKNEETNQVPSFRH